MDGQDIKTKILECECGARLVPQVDGHELRGTCPACGKKLVMRIDPAKTEQIPPKDSPPPQVQINKEVVKLPLPDDGLEESGRSYLTFSSDIKIRSREAASLVSRGKIVEAIALYRWICEENPEHRDAYYGLGFCYYKLGDLHRSRWMLEKALALEHPNAGKLLMKVTQKIEEEMKLKKLKEEVKREISGQKEPGEFILDESE
ncbi:MAG TPA: hypothetical protein PLT82_00365 [Candidatus Hydrogenedens sp.]|nr:tetratricopeptide repeat protein [Candidatus Hydrogenedens sp.]HOK08759.1 hypothetical protein [Candidatus Hydrogenedens sp.]HOL18933.1 hypothetical protein [Candidatus Hydrogenedens sp.]HPP57567.1 hypothetical protein [Candidatus Hydrogenedens sp.]